MGHKLPMERERQLLQVVQSLVDADARAREAAVAAAMAEDPAYGTALQRVLERLVTDDRDEQLAQPAAESDSGERLGPWRLHERIGSGGMGDVYRASRDDGAFQREVALKRIWSGGASPLAARFLQERNLLARLQHPHIAQLLDGGVHQGQPWFAMELVQGAPITRWCDSRQLGLRARVELIEQLCDALDFAHRNLVVHRDIKPGNVLVDACGSVKLLDFGIAKLLDEGDPQRTQTLAMTPAWAAPEQRRGDPVTTALDIWQVGTLLRLLASGDSGGGDPQVSASVAWQRLQRDDPAQAQRLAQARDTTAALLLRQLRGDLDSIIARATREDPAQRYPLAGALAADLRAWRHGLPVSARRSERGYRARKWLRRWWPALAAAGAAAAFAGYHLHALNAGLAREQALRRQAQAAQAATARERDRSEEVNRFLVTLFEQASPAEIASGQLDARAMLARTSHRLEAERGRSPQARGVLRANLAEIGVALGQFPQAGRDAEAALREFARDPATPPELTAQAWGALAKSRAYSDDLPGAVVAIDRAVHAMARSSKRGGLAHARLLVNQWTLLSAVGQSDRAAKVRRQALPVLAALGDQAAAHYATLLLNGAAEALMEGDAAAAHAAAGQAQAAFARAAVDDPAGVLLAQTLRAGALSELGRHAQALALAATAMPRLQAYYGRAHPQLLTSQGVLAGVALRAGDVARADAWLRLAETQAPALVAAGVSSAHWSVQPLRILVDLRTGRRTAALAGLRALRRQPGVSAVYGPALLDAMDACVEWPGPPATRQLQAALRAQPTDDHLRHMAGLAWQDACSVAP